MEAFFDQSYTMFWGNSGIYKNKATSLWKFFSSSGLEKIRHGISIVEACYQLSSRKGNTQSVINGTVICQLS